MQKQTEPNRVPASSWKISGDTCEHMVSGHACHMTSEALLWLAGLAASVLFSQHPLLKSHPHREGWFLWLSGGGASFPLLVTSLWHYYVKDVMSSCNMQQNRGIMGLFLQAHHTSPLQVCYYDDTANWHYDLLPSVSLLVSGARAGSTREVAGKSLNQPMTMLDRSRSSNRIWADPMKDLWSIRP